MKKSTSHSKGADILKQNEMASITDFIAQQDINLKSFKKRVETVQGDLKMTNLESSVSTLNKTELRSRCSTVKRNDYVISVPEESTRYLEEEPTV